MKVSDLNPDQLEKAASMLKAIAHPMRIAILNFLEDGKKLTVTEIHNLLKIEHFQWDNIFMRKFSHEFF